MLCIIAPCSLVHTRTNIIVFCVHSWQGGLCSEISTYLVRFCVYNIECVSVVQGVCVHML